MKAAIQVAEFAKAMIEHFEFVAGMEHSLGHKEASDAIYKMARKLRQELHKIETAQYADESISDAIQRFQSSTN